MKHANTKNKKTDAGRAWRPKNQVRVCEPYAGAKKKRKGSLVWCSYICASSSRCGEKWWNAGPGDERRRSNYLLFSIWLSRCFGGRTHTVGRAAVPASARPVGTRIASATRNPRHSCCPTPRCGQERIPTFPIGKKHLLPFTRQALPKPRTRAYYRTPGVNAVCRS